MFSTVIFIVIISSDNLVLFSEVVNLPIGLYFPTNVNTESTNGATTSSSMGKKDSKCVRMSSWRKCDGNTKDNT